MKMRVPIRIIGILAGSGETRKEQIICHYTGGLVQKHEIIQNIDKAVERILSFGMGGEKVPNNLGCREHGGRGPKVPHALDHV
jgi:hypothetical protein